jgi:nitrogen regulatory protein PII
MGTWFLSNLVLETIGEIMQMIAAIIQPYMLENVRDALSKVGVQGLTVTEVKGFGRQKGHTELYRGAEYTVDFVNKIKIEVGVRDTQVDDGIDAIQNSAHSGRVGDGKIFVYPLIKVIRIRSGETDEAAL